MVEIIFARFGVQRKWLRSFFRFVEIIIITFLLVGCVTWCRVLKLAFIYLFTKKYEPRHEKTNVLHMRKQRRRSASR